MKTLQLLGISGSLREGSYNTALLQATSKLLPEGVELEIYSLKDLPMYDGDLEAKGLPDIVQRLKDKIEGADALLFATPEYNHSVSGALKNAIDWASRPPRNSLQGKPVAIMSASMGGFAGVRAQVHLKQILSNVDTRLLNKPEIAVGQAHMKFNEQGILTDETALQLIKEMLLKLKDWTKTVSTSS